MREAVEFAEEGPEHPVIGQIVDEMNPRAEERHHQVGHCQVDDVVVGGVVQSLVAPHDVDDQQVACDRQQDDDYVEDNLDDHFGQHNRFEVSLIRNSTFIISVTVQNKWFRKVVHRLLIGDG